MQDELLGTQDEGHQLHARGGRQDRSRRVLAQLHRNASQRTKERNPS
jgi:hypothetical protein